MDNPSARLVAAPASDTALDVLLESPAIARLIEEVRGTDVEVTRAYNRTYNRHNR